MRKIIISLSVGIASLLIGSFFYWRSQKAKTNESKKPTVSIGSVLPLTGDQLSFPGNRILNGIELALSEADTSIININYHSEDSKGKTSEAISAAQKLIDFNKVDFIIGGLLSSTTIGMLPHANENEIVLISPTASSPDLAKPNDFFFRVWPSDKQDGILSSNYCYGELSLKNMGIIYWNNDYAIGLKNAFSDNFEKLGGKVLVELAYDGSITNYSPLIGSLKRRHNVDGVYLPGIPTSNANIVKKIIENNLDIIVFSNLSAQENIFREIAGDAIDNVYFTNLSFDENLFNGSQFYINYKSKFGEEPDIQSLKGYEAAQLILDAVSNGYTEPSEFQSFIDSKEYFTFYSDSLKFDRNGDAVVKYNVNKYSSGKIEILLKD